MLPFFLSVFIGSFLVISLLLRRWGKQSERTSAKRLLQLTARPVNASRFLYRRMWIPHVVTYLARPLQKKIGWLSGNGLRERLVAAGFSGDLPGHIYVMVRVTALPMGLLAGILLPASHLLAASITSTAFWVGPDVLLRQRIRTRRGRIRLSIPDFVDLMVICIEAGLGMDQAVLRVAEELAVSHPVTHEFLLQVTNEQKAGKPRREAWQDAARRVQLREIDDFVSMLVQAERFGTPISRAMTAFGHQIRTHRTQVAEEQAAKTTIKILFPLVLFLFPTIFIVLLGPAVLTMIRNLPEVR